MHKLWPTVGLISSDSNSDDEEERVTAGGSATSTSSSEALKSNCPNDIAQIAAFPPAQPVNIRFPTTIISNKARSFNSAWYSMYNWLEHSVESDACLYAGCLEPKAVNLVVDHN